MDFSNKGVVALGSTTANDRIELLAEEIKDLLHPHAADDVKLVQKGLMLFRQGMVKQLQIWNAQITAMVQDVTPCYVKLNFARLSSSSCTCPNEGLCRHQMAVFLLLIRGWAVSLIGLLSGGNR